MTDQDEFKMRQDMERAQLAQQLLENPALIAAFDALEEEYIQAWKNTTVRDEDGRKQIWWAMQAKDKFREHLQKMVVNGHVASAQIAQDFRPPKRWGVV